VTRQQFALGTAQFGLDYGVTNTRGRLDDATMRAVLEASRDAGITLLDTASGYGDSEQRLGAALQALAGHPWQVMTKTPAVPTAAVDDDAIANLTRAWHTSQTRLAPARIDALLVHQADDLLKPGAERLVTWLQALREAGEVRQIGISVYDPRQLDAVVSRHAGTVFDIVQLPANIADQRWVRHPLLRKMRQAGTAIHVRSLFLQGLLLAPGADTSFAGPDAADWLRRFHAEVARRGRSPLQACLEFFRSQADFDVAVIGATSAHELAQIVSAFESCEPRSWADWPAAGGWADPRKWVRP
jgi:aryl-alcohol dehydrogenase-like predicted oxidoreductase